MNHPLVLSDGSGTTTGDGSYWEEAIALGIRFGTLLQTLVIPLLVAIGVQFALQLYITVRREADRQLRRHVETLQRDRQRLIEEIKIDLLRTLNKGAKEPSGGGSSATPPLVAGSGEVEDRTYDATKERLECRQRVVEQKLDPSSSSPAKNGRNWSNGQPKNRTTESPSTPKTAEWAPSRQLDRKDRSNIVNEIIYQIQSGTRIAEDGGGEQPLKTSRSTGSGSSAEDTAVLRDVHSRNVVARMKTLFEQEKPTPPRFSSGPVKTTPERQLPKVPPALRHFTSVVNILRRNDPPNTASPSARGISASLENLRPSGGGGQFLKASSEPPTMIRLRRRIRSQHSLSESVEDILESERFSKRLSQYSISDLLDEEEPSSNNFLRHNGQTNQSVPYDRVSRGLKTLSTFSLSELLQDEETVDGGEVEPEVVLRNAQQAPPAHYRNAVDNIEQILVAENLSKDYWKYSISNLLDFMEEDGGAGLVALEEYTQYGDVRQST